jgi:hypothetical protein
MNGVDGRHFFDVRFLIYSFVENNNISGKTRRPQKSLEIED